MGKDSSDSYVSALLAAINSELKANPDFADQLIQFMVVGVTRAPDVEKNKFFNLLKKHVPVEWFMTLEAIKESE